MPTYDEIKSSHISKAVSSSIRGVPLDITIKGGRIPISPCICVTEPCPCDTLDDIIIWLPQDTPSDRTGLKASGDDVFEYELSANAEVLVEALIPMRIAQLEQLKAIAEQPRSKAGVVYKKAAKGKKLGTAAAVEGAFALGWAIGTKIDEATGASDEISDWLADNIPWPF